MEEGGIALPQRLSGLLRFARNDEAAVPSHHLMHVDHDAVRMPCR
ncbi:hypothetical protein ABIA96_001051 [Bradyrhizobium sp. LB11.1]